MAAPSTSPARAVGPAISEFGYWMTHYRRTWRSSIVISVLNPLLFFLGIGVGLGALIDRNAAASLGHVSYLAFLAPGLLAFRIATSSAAFLVVLLAAGLATSPLALLALPVAVLTGLAFAIPFMALGVSVRQEESVRGVYRFLVMPLYLFSGTYVAVSQLPAVIRPLAYALPLWHGVQLCRGLTLGTLTPAAAVAHTGYLCGVAVLGLIVARAAYRRQLHD